MTRRFAILIFVVLLLSSLGCERSVRESLVDAPSPPILEITYQSFGMVTYTGAVLGMRVESSGSLEMDCLRDYSVSVSESNIYRVNVQPPLAELSKIQQLIDATIVDAKSKYINPRNLPVDSVDTTKVVIKGTDSTEKWIFIQGGYSIQMKDDPDIPRSLHEIFATVSSIYLRTCSQNK